MDMALVDVESIKVLTSLGSKWKRYRGHVVFRSSSFCHCHSWAFLANADAVDLNQDLNRDPNRSRPQKRG